MAWSIWRIPRPAIILVLSVEVATVFLSALAIGPITDADLKIALCLVGLSISYSALSYTWERARRALWERTTRAGMLYRNLLAVWCFAAAVTLPMPLAAAVVLLGAAAEWPSLKISSQALPY